MLRHWIDTLAEVTDTRFRLARLPFRILSFLFFLSALRRFRLPVAFPAPCASLSVRSGFPLPYRLVSHPVSPVPLIQLSCSFPFALPCFAPTAVPQVLPSSSGSYALSFRLRPCSRALRFHPAFAVLPLPSRPFRIFTTQLLFLPFPSSTFRLTGASRVPSSLSSPSRSWLVIRFSAVSFGSRLLPFGRLRSPLSSASVLGSAALPFTAHTFASQRLLCSLAFPLGFRPSP